MNEWWSSLVVQHLRFEFSPEKVYLFASSLYSTLNLNVINSIPHTWEKSQPLFQDLMLICLAEYQIISPLQSKVSMHA